MTKKRALMDAVNDQTVIKLPVESSPKKHSHPIAKVVVALILGFAGGLLVGL